MSPDVFQMLGVLMVPSAVALNAELKPPVRWRDPKGYWSRRRAFGRIPEQARGCRPKDPVL